jgi:hypothetical protein
MRSSLVRAGLVPLLLLLSLVVRVGSAGAAPEGTMTWGVHVTLAARWLDPNDTEAFIAPFLVLYAIHDALVKPMPGGDNTPCLAESWTVSKDGLSYEFVLRKGAKFHNGEPVTAARLAVIRRVGAEALPLYIAMETWRLGEGCMAPESADDVHFLSDLHACVQTGAAGAELGLPPSALLVTSLRRTAPLVLLNAGLGDQAVVVARHCGCPLERLGWTTHLHTIRSYEKLTAGGMTFLDADAIRVLEEVLPARFGGVPTDYQLVEDESDGGEVRVRLLVRPEVGPVDPAAVAEAFLAALSGGAGAERIMGQVWRDGRILRVERRAPFTTASGKILHLHLERRPNP